MIDTDYPRVVVLIYRHCHFRVEGEYLDCFRTRIGGKQPLGTVNERMDRFAFVTLAASIRIPLPLSDAPLQIVLTRPSITLCHKGVIIVRTVTNIVIPPMWISFVDRATAPRSRRTALVTELKTAEAFHLITRVGYLFNMGAAMGTWSCGFFQHLASKVVHAFSHCHDRRGRFLGGGRRKGSSQNGLHFILGQGRGTNWTARWATGVARSFHRFDPLDETVATDRVAALAEWP
jgi:hypothetical protein